MVDFHRFLLLVIAGVTGWLVYVLSPILTPFMAGATLAYLADPLVDRLERRGLGRMGAVLVVFLALFVALGLVLVGLIPALESQISHLVEALPSALRWFKSTLTPWLRTHLGINVQLRDLDGITNLISQHWQQAGGVASYVFTSLSHSGMAVLGWVANLFLIPVVTFYLLRDWDTLVARLYDLLPRRYAPTAVRLVGEADSVLSAFMRGQLTVMLCLGILYSTGLWLVGLEVAFLIGLMAGLISFIPYAGAIVGVLAAVLAALLQFGEPWPVLGVLAVFGIGQAVEGMFLTPWLVGDRIGLHPVAVIFSVLAGGQLFGFLGVLLALPAASVIMVLFRHIHDLYKDSTFYGRPPAAVPPKADEAPPDDEH